MPNTLKKNIHWQTNSNILILENSRKEKYVKFSCPQKHSFLIEKLDKNDTDYLSEWAGDVFILKIWVFYIYSSVILTEWLWGYEEEKDEDEEKKIL